MPHVVVTGLAAPGIHQEAPDFWNVDFDVHPNPFRFSYDVMLVQCLLVTYFLDPSGAVRADLKARAMTIIASMGKKFSDGIYGGNTRQVMTLFEEDMRAPFKDGIVRTVPLGVSEIGPEMKLKRLNFTWNMTMLSDTLGTTKKESGRTALPPALFSQLYH